MSMVCVAGAGNYINTMITGLSNVMCQYLKHVSSQSRCYSHPLEKLRPTATTYSYGLRSTYVGVTLRYAAGGPHTYALGQP